MIFQNIHQTFSHLSTRILSLREQRDAPGPQSANQDGADGVHEPIEWLASLQNVNAFQFVVGVGSFSAQNARG
jgi:hypothetical protein